MASSQLIQGAKAVAKAQTEGQTAGAYSAIATARFLAEGTGKVIQKRNKEFNTIMNRELNKEGLTDEEYQKTYERLKRMRVGYVYLNKKDRMDVERKIIEDANKERENEEIKQETIEIIKDENLPVDQLPEAVENMITRGDYAASKSSLEEFVIKGPNGENLLKSYGGAWRDGRFKVSADGKFKTDKFGNKYTNDKAGEAEFTRNAKLYWIRKAKETGNKVLHYNSTTGKREYLTPEEAEALLMDDSQKVTAEEIRDHVKGRIQNKNTTKAINDNISSGRTKAVNYKEGDKDFNITESKSRYSKIVNKGNALDLAVTNQVGDTSFEQDLTEALTNNTYEQLGISSKLIGKFDPTKDGKVSQEDAKVIVEKVLQDGDNLPKHLVNYFSLYEQREYVNNLPQEEKNLYSKMGQTRNETQLKPLIQNYINDQVGSGNFVVDEALAGQNAVRVTNVETKQSKIISLGGPFDGVFTRGNTNEKIKEIDSFLQGGVATNEDVQGGTITQVNGQNVFKR